MGGIILGRYLWFTVYLSLLLLIFSVAALAYNSQNCDLTTYVRECWPGEFENYDIVTWNDVNSVANTGEDYQLLAGIEPETIKKHLTSSDVLEGFALGKVSQDYLTYIYCSDPTYWAGMKAQAEMGSEYERYYKYYQGKVPSTVTSNSVHTDTSAKEEQTSKNETTTKDEREAPGTKIAQADNILLNENITGLFVVTVDTVVLDAPNGNKIDTFEKGTEITVAGSGNGYYQLKYNDKTGFILIDDETIIPKEEYDKAWTETGRVEPTCTENGYYTLTNSYSQIEKTTPIAATGHDEGKWTTTNKARLFTKGLEQRLCTKCDEVLEEREINAIISLPIAILVGCLAIITVTILTLFFKKKSFKTKY